MKHLHSKASDLVEIASRRWFEDLADRGIIVTDADLVIRAWNPWLVAHTGVAAEAAIGNSLFAVCPVIEERGLDEHYLGALRGEVRMLAHRFHKFLIPVLRTAAIPDVDDGTQTARIAPLTSEGLIVGTITIVEDVSERVVRERELRNQILVSNQARVVAEDASKLKDEFLATLSHEIRTPLNAVLGWTQILRTQSNVKSLEHALAVIERNAASQLRLVEDLLDSARIMSGKLLLDLKPIEVQSIVQAALDVVGPGAAAKGIVIRTRIAERGIPVDADVDRLQQAIWNVMSNAVKFTGAGGTIDVTVAATARIVTISVADTGQGISPAFLPYVFERFRQGDASASRRHGGLGLGLALSRQIVELHGGSIRVESVGVGKGATFEIQLPITHSAVMAATIVKPEMSNEMLLGVTVLLVDDCVDGREMLAASLRGYGATVVEVESTDAAFALLASEALSPDILVSDIGMPDVDGYQFIRRLRSSSDTIRHTLAIAVTAYAEPEDRLQALAAGYQLHVSKPADPAVLAASIQRLVIAARSLR